MNMENQPLVTNVTVEYDKFEVQGLRKIIDQLDESIEYASN